MPAAALLPLAFAGGGAVAGALSNTKSARTGETSGQSDQNQTYSNTASNTGTTTTSKNLNEYQSAVQPDLYGYGLDLIKNPNTYINPIRKAATAKINQAYASAPSTIAQKMLAYGGAKSGKFGKAMVQSELSRYSDINNLEGQLAPLTMQQQNFGADLLKQMLGLNYGQTTTTDNSASSSGTSSASGTSSGTYVNPGSAVAGGVSGGLDGLLSAILFHNMLGAGAGGGGYNPSLGGGGYDPNVLGGNL